MIHTVKSVAAGAGVIVLALCVLIAWPSMQARMQPSPPTYAIFFGGGDNVPSARWHMLIYLDINSCLTCTEDMGAWRKFETELTESGGELSLWSPPSDSLDVAEAMRLEGMQTPVQVLDSNAVRELGWKKLGTPVKVLLDNHYRLVKIAGRMGNVRESTCFFDTLGQYLRATDAAAFASQ